MRRLVLLVVLGLGVTARAQDTCSLSAYGSSSLVPGYGPTPDAALFPAREVNVTRTIPVFFHVVRKSTESRQLDIPTLQLQVDSLNRRFATQLGGSAWNVPRYRFTLAGADLVINNTWAEEGVEGNRPASSGEFAMKELLAVDPARVLNVYVVRAVARDTVRGPDFPPTAVTSVVNGYALYPFPFNYGGERGQFPVDALPSRQFDSHWGIVLNPRALPGGSPGADGTTLVHEVGHYLGLFHPYADNGETCVSVTDCRTTGDFVCDTPKVASPPGGTSTCTHVQCGSGDPPLGNNVMYTAPNSCRTRFTNTGLPSVPQIPPPVGQQWRMAIMGAVYKPAFGEPGVLPTLPSVPASQQTGASYTTVVERRIISGTWRTSPDADMLVAAPLTVAPGVEVRAAPGRAVVAQATLDASGATFTALDPAAGWQGARFEPGSGGTWTDTVVERVLGGPVYGPGEPQAEPLVPPAAIRITGASPTFTDIRIRFPAQNTRLTGILVNGAAGHTTAPVVVRGIIQEMLTAGVSINGGGRVDLVRGQILGGGDAVVTGGSTSRTYLVPAYDASGGGRFEGPTLSGNSRGIVAVGGSEVRTGTGSVSGPGYGLTTVTGNSARGLAAYSGAAIYAGTGAPGSGTYQRNRIFSNAPASPTGNGLASGTGSRVYARCTWWNTLNPGTFRAGQAAGGLLDASYYLTADPFTTPDPPCEIAIQIDGLGRAAGTGSSASRGSDAPAARGTPEAEATALDRLALALSATTPAEAVAVLSALVAEMPETEAAFAALGEAGTIAARPGAPASALSLIASATGSAHAPLRMAAWQALVAARLALGDGTGALAAADTLDAAGAHVPAETARVYLYGEAGDRAQAEAALASLDALAPGSVEADLARAFLGAAGGAPLGGRSAGGHNRGGGQTTAEASVEATDAEALSLSVAPNPAGASASVQLTLPEAADVSLEVHDLLGRIVAMPHAGMLVAGVHRLSVPLSGLAPGMCVVRATVVTETRTVVRAVRLTVAR